MNDSQWSKDVRERDKHRCRLQIAGCFGKATEAHHIFPRILKLLRLEINNGISVCQNCHGWAERNPRDSLKFILLKLLKEDEREHIVEIVRDNYPHIEIPEECLNT